MKMFSHFVPPSVLDPNRGNIGRIERETDGIGVYRKRIPWIFRVIRMPSRGDNEA
jgi:hypothetical protein